MKEFKDEQLVMYLNPNKEWELGKHGSIPEYWGVLDDNSVKYHPTEITPATEELYFEKFMEPDGWRPNKNTPPVYLLRVSEIPDIIIYNDFEVIIDPELDYDNGVEKILVNNELIEAQQQALTHANNLKMIRGWESK